jgi:teichuronic acid biosynthesis glycosyltransferase TuaC
MKTERLSAAAAAESRALPVDGLPDPLRVLSFTSIFPNSQQPAHGGFVRDRVAALAALCDLRVVAPVPWTPPGPWLPASYRAYQTIPPVETQGHLTVSHPRFMVVPKLLKSTDGILMALSLRPQLRSLRERFHFDVVDAHWAYPDGVAAAVVARDSGVPLALTVRGDDVNVFGRERGRRQSIRWALRQASVIIALSEGLKDGVEALIGPSDRVVVIPNGIDATRFRRQPRAAARARLGLDAASPIMLSVGRLHLSKGFPILVEALGRLRDSHPDLRLIIVGGPDREADATPHIRVAADRYGVAERVRLVGPQSVDQMTDWYSAADVFCLATEREGSPNVILEALACGLPCLATPAGEIASLLADGRVGRIVAAEPAAFAGAVADALAKRWNRDDIAARGLRRTWQTVALECFGALKQATTRSAAVA